MPESSVQRWASCPQGTQPPSPGLCLEWALFTSSGCSPPHADIDPACWHAPWQRLQMPGRTSESQTKCSLDVSETEQGQVQCWELRSAKDAARSTLGLLSKIAFIRCFRASGVSLRSWCLRTIPAVLAQLTASCRDTHGQEAPGGRCDSAPCIFFWKMEPGLASTASPV